MKGLTTVIVALIVIVCAGVAGTAYALKAVDNADAMRNYSNVVDVKDFTGISAANAIDVFYTQGAKSPVKIVATERLLQYVEVSVSNGTLELRMSEKYNDSSNKLRRKGDKVQIYVSAPSVSRFDANTAATINCTGNLKVSGKLHAIASTSGDLKLGVVEAESADVDGSTSGDVVMESLSLTGDALLDASTSGDVTLKKMQARKVKAVASTSGDVTLGDATIYSLTAESSTSGDVTVKGRGTTLDVDCSTGGDFNGKDFVVEDATVQASVGGDAYVNAVRCNASTSLGGSVKNYN